MEPALRSTAAVEVAGEAAAGDVAGEAAAAAGREADAGDVAGEAAAAAGRGEAAAGVEGACIVNKARHGKRKSYTTALAAPAARFECGSKIRIGKVRVRSLAVR